MPGLFLIAPERCAFWPRVAPLASPQDTTFLSPHLVYKCWQLRRESSTLPHMERKATLSSQQAPTQQ
ncbi:hypothetical protein SAMN06265373_106140 [Shimia sagamensis]|uniref:Uncharacterized protein n=1 Tax=Shimia sagamensis TaxID=1566352 RepID=A0ABY1P8N4_9RHOB|nr:hypothetical protein SAMN06265373_106140 [Shimia sagamensis]